MRSPINAHRCAGAYGTLQYWILTLGRSHYVSVHSYGKSVWFTVLSAVTLHYTPMGRAALECSFTCLCPRETSATSNWGVICTGNSILQVPQRYLYSLWVIQECHISLTQLRIRAQAFVTLLR